MVLNIINFDGSFYILLYNLFTNIEVSLLLLLLLLRAESWGVGELSVSSNL